MKAIVVDAEWAPRPGVDVAPDDARRHWAVNANQVYRSPKIELQTVSDPTGPGDHELIVKVGSCGICGSDVHMYETDADDYMLLPYHMRCPVVGGHEFAGEVVEVGSGVKGFAIGDLVTVEEIQWCGNCLACRGGYPNQCSFIEDLGFTIDGGFAEYVKVPEKACWNLNALVERYGSQETALEVGSMSEPTSVVYEGMFTRAGGFKPGGAVVVFGAGPIGLAACALAAAAGASRVICAETVAERRALALACGADTAVDPGAQDVGEVVSELTQGRGAAMAVEASGNFAAVMGSIEDCLGVGAKVAVIGMDARPATLNLIRHQLAAASVYGSVGHCGGWNFPNVIALMASGRIRMENAVTKRVGLEGMVTALAGTSSRRDGKILVSPGAAA
jgi:threonine dehydrogenase-like Zn-dependent dehydrogenase